MADISSGQVGGGSFSGRAIYDNGVFDGVAEDVAPLVSIISPTETPLLTRFGDPNYAAKSTKHEFVEDEMPPNALITASAVASNDGSDSAIGIAHGDTHYIRPGAILASDDLMEYMRVVAVVGNTVMVNRAYGGTAVSAHAVGDYLTIVSQLSTDGRDTTTNTSRARDRIDNNTQIISKDVIVSGTVMAVNQLGGITNEFDYQTRKETKQCLIDLEKSVVMGLINPSSAVGQTRSMRGIAQYLNTNSIAASIGVTLTSPDIHAFSEQLDEATRLAWLRGANDLDIMVCGEAVARRIDMLNASTSRQPNTSEEFHRVINTYENRWGRFEIMMNRWVPIHMCLILASNRIDVVPLQTRSFHFEPSAKTGDAHKGQVLGEYTLELRNEAGMSKVTWAALAPSAGHRLIFAR